MSEIIFKNKTVFYQKQGQGNCLVLLHGYCEDSFIFENHIALLAEKFTLILMDIPGFGKSEIPTEQPTLNYYAESVLAVLKNEKIETFTLGGHSMGGYIALQFAALFPTLLTGLILINSHCFLDTEERVKNRKKTIEFVKKHGKEFFLQEFYKNLFPTNKQLEFEWVIKSFAQRNEFLSETAIVQAGEAMLLRSDTSSILKNAPFPILIFGGGMDASIPAEYYLKMASLANFTVFEFEANRGHMAQYEMGEEFTLAILKFMLAPTKVSA